MDITKYQVYAYQLLHYFITICNYTLVRVEDQQDDIWLINPNAKQYPVIRISANKEETLEGISKIHHELLQMIHRKERLLSMHTDPDCDLIDQQEILQIHIAPNSISNMTILKTFQNIQNIIHDVKDPLEEVALLSRSIEEKQLKKQQEIKSYIKKILQPNVTFFLIAICFIISAIGFACNEIFHDNKLALIAVGGYYRNHVVVANEYIRMFIYPFFHASLLSLAWNSMVMYEVGKYCELLFTKGQYLLMVLICGATGCVFVHIFSDITYLSGAGVWIVSLVSAYFVACLESNTYHLKFASESMIEVFVLMVLTIIFTNMSLWLVLGAMISGILCAMSFLNIRKFQVLRRNARITLILMIVILGIWTFKQESFITISKEENEKIFAMYDHKYWKPYQNYLRNCYNIEDDMEGTYEKN